MQTNIPHSCRRGGQIVALGRLGRERCCIRGNSAPTAPAARLESGSSRVQTRSPKEAPASSRRSASGDAAPRACSRSFASRAVGGDAPTSHPHLALQHHRTRGENELQRRPGPRQELPTAPLRRGPIARATRCPHERSAVARALLSSPMPRSLQRSRGRRIMLRLASRVHYSSVSPELRWPPR